MSRLNRLTAVAGALVGMAQVVAAQPATGAFTGVVEAGAVVQRYSTGQDLSVRETSAPFGAAVRHASGFGVSVRGLYATAGGDGLATLSGLADVQAGASFRRRLGGAAVEVAITASAPGGEPSLSDTEFPTAATLATDDYAFDVPTLGQGSTVSPALTLVVPLGGGLALGAGAAYYSRGAFVPFDGSTEEYTPADEIAVTGGFTAQTGPASTFSLDASVVSYGDDAFGGQSFSPGNRITGTMRLLAGGGTVRGRFVARYRHVVDGTAGASSRPVVYQRPEHALVAVGVGLFGAGVGVELSGGVRYYGTLNLVDSDNPDTILNALGQHQVLIDIGAAPSVEVAGRARLQGVFTYTVGVAEVAGASPLSGFRAGAGLAVFF